RAGWRAASSLLWAFRSGAHQCLGPSCVLSLRSNLRLAISLRDRTGSYTTGRGLQRRTDRWRLIEGRVRVDHEVAFGEHLLTAHHAVGTDPDAEPRGEVGTDERDDG